MITQPVAIAISVVLFVLTAVAFWYFAFHLDTDRVLAAMGIPVLLFLIAGGSLFWSLDDNFYDIKSGVVVDQSFTPAHQDPPTIVSTGKVTTVIPGGWVEDDWAIEIQGSNGKTGWIHFGNDVLADYPEGSNYPN